MNPLLTGSAPVLVLGGSPAGVVCAEVLSAHGIPVTLVGEGRPFGGRGRPVLGKKPERPVWPFGFSKVPTTHSRELTRLLAKAHGRGACVQPADQLRSVVVEDNRVTEVLLEGVMGVVRRRPRFVVVASRGDIFMKMCSPTQEMSNGVKEIRGEFKDELVLHLIWTGLQSQEGPSQRQFSIDDWECICVTDGRSKEGIHWACRPKSDIDLEDSAPVARMLAPHLLAASGLEGESLTHEPHTETRIVRDATLRGIHDSANGSDGIFEPCLKNVAFIGQGGGLTPMTVDDEMDKAREIVSGWLRP